MTAPLYLPAAVTRDYLLHHRVCPKPLSDDGSLVVATTDGSLLSRADDLAFAYERRVTLEAVAREELVNLLYSFGKNGKPGGDGEDADIRSWNGPVRQ